jgi:hypothetical protein
MSWELRTAVIKGRKECINAELNKNSMFDVRDVKEFASGMVLYRVNLGDIYCKDDFSDVPFADNKNLKFIILANNDEEYGDKVMFKQFGDSGVKIGIAFDPKFVSTYMEELECNEIPFMDEPFEFEMESYSDGEYYNVKNAMTFTEEWEDDSRFVAL